MPGLTFMDVGGCGCITGVSFCGCTVPLTGTLTSSILGSFAMTLNPAHTIFNGSKTYAYPGNAFCVALGTPMTATITCTNPTTPIWKLQFSWFYDTGGCGLCPTGAGGTGHPTLSFSSSSVSCSPLSITWTVPASAVQGCIGAGNVLNNLLCCDNCTDTWTFTP